MRNFLSSASLSSLRFFTVAARRLSFRQAAAELHVTQGAVSQHIKQLEQALGCNLFFRLPKQIKLTDEGRRFADVADRALADIDQAANALAREGAAVELRVRAGPSFALRWLVPRLGEFYAQFPRMKLFILGEYGYLDPARRDFDLAIEMAGGKIAGLQSELFLREQLTPVCSAAYLGEHKFLRRPEDLGRCVLLHDAHAMTGTGRDGEWRHWLRETGTEQVDSTQGQFFTLANMSMEAALNSQGVAMGRTTLIKELLATKQLVAPFGQKMVESPLSYYLMYPKELADRPDMRAIITWLHEQAKHGGKHAQGAG